MMPVAARPRNLGEVQREAYAAMPPPLCCARMTFGRAAGEGARRRRSGLGLGLAAALGISSGHARADLVADAERVERSLRQRGGEVEHLAPVFLERGRIRALTAVRAGPVGRDSAGCATVAFLAGRGVDFVVDPLGAEDGNAASRPSAQKAVPSKGEAANDTRTPSFAGAAVLVRCGAARADLQRILLEMVSQRGAIEVFVAYSPEPLASLAEILPERAPGPSAPRGDPGPPADPGPLEARIASVDRRARADGAERIASATMRASSRGAGEFELRLGEGCHRLLVLAEVPAESPHRPTDVDAEARLPVSGRVLVRDRGEAPDARLELCLGETTVVELPYVGAAGPVTVAMVDAAWSLPKAVPTQWGPRARAGIAGALRRRSPPEPTSAPVLEALGVQGLTAVPVPTQPGRCYLAALGVVRGDARGLRLAARLGTSFPRDEADGRADGAALAFCAETEEVVTLDVEARGSTPWWTLVVWPMGATDP